MDIVKITVSKVRTFVTNVPIGTELHFDKGQIW